MPLARYALLAQGEQIHVAPTWDRGEPFPPGGCVDPRGEKPGQAHVLGQSGLHIVTSYPTRTSPVPT